MPVTDWLGIILMLGTTAVVGVHIFNYGADGDRHGQLNQCRQELREKDAEIRGLERGAGMSK